MRFPLLAIAGLMVALPIAAQRPVARSAASPPLPMDTATHTGKLANGVRYWVRRNGYPEKRLELRLVIRAGSILEDADQLGLAHFVEHMAFNGTTHFAKNDLVKYLESVGVRFGADLNASTGFDETTYILPVPSDKPELVAMAFEILQDWASGVTFDSAAVVKERGVVLGEWRDGLGAGSRVRDKQFPVLFQGSRYATRLPIGDTAIIAHANPGPMKRFYREWYRPDLMGVIAVGDYPVDSLKALIASRFGSLRGPARPRARLEAPVPEIPGTRVVIVTDPELSTENVSLMIRRREVSYRTEADHRHQILNQLFSLISGQRLTELARRPETPFAWAYLGPSSLIRDIETTQLGLTAKSGKAAASFEAVLRELRRLELHGVLPAELERAKADMLSSDAQAAANEDGQKRNSWGIVGSYLRAFTTGAVPISNHDEYALDQRLLPTITVTEVNTAIRTMARGADRFIAVQGPTGSESRLPARAELLAIIARADTATLPPWTETVIAGDLVPNPPAPGRIISETTDSALGLTDWRLSNGIRVLVKPTAFKADEIKMAANSPGGLSLLSDQDVFQGMFATTIVDQSGYGAFDSPTLRRKLAGKIVNLSPDIGDIGEGFSGETTPKDLPTFFELLWLEATAPRLDSSAVAALREQFRTVLAGRDRLPQTAFNDTVVITIGHNSPRMQPLTLAKAETLDPARALQIYHERFTDFGDFTFIFVGNVTLEALRPLVERWIGGLPARAQHEPWKDVDPPNLEGVITKVVRKGKEPVAQQLVFFQGPTPATGPDARIAAAAAAGILETRLLEQLREAMGATYGVQASSEVSAIPRMTYTSTISFSSKPELADSLWSATQRTIAALQADGPTADELAKFVAQQQRSGEVAVRTNDFWTGTLMQRVRVGEPIGTIIDWSKRLAALTPAVVRDAARHVLDTSRLARFVLLPEQP